MFKRAKSLVGIIVISGGALVFGGCGLSREELIKKAGDNGVIIHFNGFLSLEAGFAAEDIARTFDMLHYSDDRSILDFLEAGESSRQGNILFAHSLGSEGAGKYARWCESKGIEIRSVYTMDAFSSEHFPKNVLEIIDYHSSEPWGFGKQRSYGGVLKTVRGSHLFLPGIVKGSVKARMQSKQRMPAYRKIPTRSGR